MKHLRQRGPVHRGWLQENPSLFECFLCLSRACLGEMMIFGIKWRENYAFSYLAEVTTPPGCWCLQLILIKRKRRSGVPFVECPRWLSRACLGKGIITLMQKVEHKHRVWFCLNSVTSIYPRRASIQKKNEKDAILNIFHAKIIISSRRLALDKS